jgi:hypothetical protein
MSAQVVRVRDHFVTTKAAGDDGTQESRGGLNGKRYRHGRRPREEGR